MGFSFILFCTDKMRMKEWEWKNENEKERQGKQDGYRHIRSRKSKTGEREWMKNEWNKIENRTNENVLYWQNNMQVF